jgi:O-antigen biosynthesis protein
LVQIAHWLGARGLARLALNGTRRFLRRHPRLKRRLVPVALRLRPILRPLAQRLAPSLGLRWRGDPALDYAAWIAEHDTLSDADRRAIRAAVAAMAAPPLISVVMPCYDTPEPLLRAAIRSVQAQLYPHWELCAADDASPDPRVAAVLAEAAAADGRIRWMRRERNGHISAATNAPWRGASGWC